MGREETERKREERIRQREGEGWREVEGRIGKEEGESEGGSKRERE